MKETSVLAPATIANVVCGFDVLGFAVEAPCDEMIVRLTDSGSIKIINRDDYNLPTEPKHNVAGATLLAVLEKVNDAIGFEVEIKKNIKPGSGIGSSAASAAGAAVAANHLLNNSFTKQELIEFAMCGEQVASGVKHADNVAPCIYGGFTLVREQNPLDVIPLDYPPLYVTIVHPQIEVRTSDARQILKQQVSLQNAIKQWGNVAGTVAGLLKGDYELIGRSLKDHIVEPIRSILIPGFAEVKTESLRAGALGGGISGSGPSIFMLSQTEELAVAVEEAMKAIYKRIGVDFYTYISNVNSQGVRIVEQG